MSISLIIAFAILLGSIVASRIMSEKALAMLSDEQKGQLFSELTSVRKMQLIPMVGLIVVFVISARMFPEQGRLIIGAYFVVFVLFMLAKQVVTFRKIDKLNFSDQFRKRYKFALSIPIVAILFLAALVFLMPEGFFHM